MCPSAEQAGQVRVLAERRLASLSSSAVGAALSADGTQAAVVDINAATVDQLTALPGIGPSLARRIVAFREEHGPFRRVEDLLKVRGIGEKSFQKLRARVRVQPEERG